MNRSPHDHEVSPTIANVACVLDCRCIAGESPVWSSLENCLYFVDHQGRKIHRFEPDTNSHNIYDLPDVVTSLAPRQSSGLIVTMRKTLAFFDVRTQQLVPLSDPEPERSANRFNDGKCDRLGRFWAGTMGALTWGEPVGTLYRLNAGGSPTPMIENVRCSNGLDWSPNHRIFYFAESFAYTIHAYDFDLASGALTHRRDFVRIAPASGAFPDGLTVDADGYVWNAQPVYGRLVRYDPQGRIDRIIETPVSRPTSCIFGGSDFATLYITSARETLTDAELAEEPLAGGLFAFRPGVRGLAGTPFAG